MDGHPPTKDGYPPEGSILETQRLNLDQVTTAIDGHLPSLGPYILYILLSSVLCFTYLIIIALYYTNLT